MAAVIQVRYTYTPITISRKVNRKAVPQASIYNIRSMDITVWILQITDKTTALNNRVLGR